MQRICKVILPCTFLLYIWQASYSHHSRKIRGCHCKEVQCNYFERLRHSLCPCISLQSNLFAPRDLLHFRMLELLDIGNTWAARRGFLNQPSNHTGLFQTDSLYNPQHRDPQHRDRGFVQGKSYASRRLRSNDQP